MSMSMSMSMSMTKKVEQKRNREMIAVAFSIHAIVLFVRERLSIYHVVESSRVEYYESSPII